MIHQDVDYRPFHEGGDFPTPLLEKSENVRPLLPGRRSGKGRRNKQKSCGKNDGAGNRLCIGSVKSWHGFSSLVIVVGLIVFSRMGSVKSSQMAEGGI
jgi:hypothetical protein